MDHSVSDGGKLFFADKKKDKTGMSCHTGQVLNCQNVSKLGEVSPPLPKDR
jgi:hypothetical protein